MMGRANPPYDRAMRRVLVIGCSGAGKSTFASQLSTATGLPLISLDAEFWQPGWRVTRRDAWRAKLSRLADGDAWIMDGHYGASLDIRLPRADTVLWFQHPRRLCMTRVLWRWLSSYGRVRPGMAQDCPERFDRDFLAYVWNFERLQVPAAWTALATHGAHIEPVIFRRDADAARFLDKMPRDTSPKGS